MPQSLSWGGSHSVELSDDLLWVNEYAWTPVVHTASYSLTGALILEAAARQAGRPIELSNATGGAFMARADVETLQAWSAMPGLQMQLVIRDEPARTVVWDASANGAPVQARPVLEWHGAPQPADEMWVTLRLLEI